MFLGILVLITALTISAVAIYYSVSGLVAIFAAAALPIIIMGGALEIGKLVTAVWLHWYWDKAKWWLKTYLQYKRPSANVYYQHGYFWLPIKSTH